MSDAEKPPGPLPPMPAVEDLVTLMASMREHKIALLEAPGVKLALMPAERTVAPVASAPQQDITPEQARANTLNARYRLEEQRTARIQAQAGLRRPPVRPPLSGLVHDVFEEAKAEQLTEERQGDSTGSKTG